MHDPGSWALNAIEKNKNKIPGRVASQLQVSCVSHLKPQKGTIGMDLTHLDPSQAEGSISTTACKGCEAIEVDRYMLNTYLGDYTHRPTAYTDGY